MQRPRTPSRLSETVHRRLNLYALAASAAGVGLLAQTTPAEAKIVYTKTHQVIGYYGICDLDLTHDGNVDFLVQQTGYTQSTTTLQLSRWLFAKPALGNGIAGKGNYASALKAGADIGHHRRFIDGGSNGATMAFVSLFSDFSIRRHRTEGDWPKANNRYLGLKFKIGGKFHYGWARLNVHAGHGVINSTLTGYAYETVPNRPLKAGQTRTGATQLSEQNSPIPSPDASRNSTLGELARGAESALLGRQP